MKIVAFFLIFLSGNLAFSGEDQCYQLTALGTKQTSVSTFDYLCQVERENANYVILVKLFGAYPLKNIFSATVNGEESVLEREVNGARSKDFPTSIFVSKESSDVEVTLKNMNSSVTFMATPARIDLLPFDLYNDSSR